MLTLTVAERERALDAFGTLPASWQNRLMGRWRDGRTNGRPARESESLLRRVLTLADCDRAGIRLDASDGEICNQAELTARDFGRRLDLQKSLIEKSPRFAAVRARYGLRAVPMMLQHFAQGILEARGLLDLWPQVADRQARQDRQRAAAMARLRCGRWWRRAYRKLHARTVEACAVDIGLVRRTACLYVSDDSVRRRVAQNARNAASLEAVTAVNEHAQEFTLAELAAKGTANKSIRRVELLTRIAGFEMIAKDCGHEAVMLTLSCPSRFHRTTTRKDGRVLDNPKWDGSTPDDAQRYLSQQWARARTCAARLGVEWYGFRIAEPQQDGTPHWHCLLFFPKGQFHTLVYVARRYFLWNDSANERGAREHRIDVERIDWKRGSAVGYVIKYVSKNIDGHAVGLDLFGNDAIESSARVEAWAATWRVRQFQQIGGAPVGVWRELRRLHPDQLAKPGAPEPLREALTAVNVAKTEPGVAAIAWKRYTILQGGAVVKRAALAVRLVKDATGEIGRYGEAMAARAMGVLAHGVELFTMPHMSAMLGAGRGEFSRRTTWSVASERAEWVIGRGLESVRAAARRVFQRSGAAASTRIHVNNCTDPFYATRSEFAPTVRTLPKLGRFRRPTAPPGGPPGILTP